MIVNYEKFGLRCGLEIHQQLNTRKLFCSCPSALRDDTPHFVVRRNLRAVSGEMGEVDVAAAYEMLKENEFDYEGYSDTTCLVEFDEAPPNPLNREALVAVLQASMLLNARPVDEIQVMRKTVVNGSNTAGFQRTALVAKNGFVETREGMVRVPTVCIEEEAARPMKKGENIVTYRLDRLGIPLIEIATDPDIKTPEQCREVAERLGMIVRSTGKAKRGIGTIRQDINVSIAGGSRVEIKGAQELNLIPRIVELEIIRQNNLIEIKKELEKRFARKTKIIPKDATKIFAHTDSEIIKRALAAAGGAVIAIPVPFFSKLIGKEVQPGKRLGTEFSDRAKAVAGVGGIIHSDENLEKYGISREEVAALSKNLGMGPQDAFIIIADRKEKAAKAVSAVIGRIHQCFDGVPREVRNANPDGTTTFMRPMPGSSRMYPETDVVPIVPQTIEISLPELISEKSSRLNRQYNLSYDLADYAAQSSQVDMFERLVEKFPLIKPAFMAEIFFGVEKALSRKYEREIKIPAEIFERIFESLNDKKISKDVISDIAYDYSQTGRLDFEKFRLLNEKELDAEVKRIVKENEGLEFNKMLGIVMSHLRGKGEPFKIIELIKKYQRL